MKKTALFLALFSCCFFLQVNATSLKGNFTAYWNNGVGTITVYPEGGGGPIVFICDPNGSFFEQANYDNYWWEFNDAYYDRLFFVDMTYSVIGGENVITGSPVFSNP